MKTLPSKLFFFFLVLFSGNAYSHSVQVAYCSSCTGDLRLFVEHWHSTEDPNSTTMTINVTINGTTTVQTGSPQGSLQNVPLANLPGCTNPIQVLASCPGDANTYNDWVIYDFTGLPCGVPLSFTIVSGNTVFTQDGCGMYPATISFTLGCGAGTLTDVNICENTPSAPINMSANATWTNSNPGIGLAASGTGPIPSFTPIGPPGTMATISYNSSCASGTFDIIVVEPTAPSFVSANHCLNDLTQLTGSDAGTLPVTTWAWDIGDDGIIESNAQNYTFTFPSGGTFPVSLTTTNAEGCSIEYLANVVIDDPQANFTSTAPCEGAVTTFTDASTITSGTIASWEWDFNGDGIPDDNTQNPSHTFATAGVHNVTLTVTSASGCEHSITLPVNVNPNPVAAFSVPLVCGGAASVFTDNSTVSSGTITAWQWDFGDGTGTSTAQNPTYTYGTIGTYNVTLTVTSSQGCVNSVTLPAGMFNQPVADFTVVGGCVTSATPFTDISNGNGGTIVTWQWDVDSDGTNDYFTQNVSHTYPGPGTYTAQLTIITGDGCSAVTTQTVTIFDVPVADFTATSVCEGNVTAFTDNSTVSSGGTIVSHSWDFDNGNTSVVQSPTETFAITGLYNVTLTVTSSSGCVNSVTLPVSVFPIPVAQFSASSECDGVATQFTDLSTVSTIDFPGSITGWSWDFGSPGIPASSLQNPTAVYPQDGSYTATVTVTSNNGCVHTTTGPVTVHPNPLPDFNSPNPAGCTQWCVNFVNASTVSSGFISSYTWNFSNGASSSLVNPIQCFDNPTLGDMTFDVSLTATTNNGCSASVTVPAFVTVYPEPVSYFSWVPQLPNVYQPSVDFVNESLIGVSYQWDFAGLGSSTATNPSFVWPNDSGGVYNVCLTTTSVMGCVNTYCAPVEVEGAWNIYVPNAFTPNGDGVNDLFFPSVFGISEEDYEFMVFDRWGDLIFRTTELDGKWDGMNKGQQCQLDVYVWKLIVREVVTGEKMDFHGHFSLLK